MNSKKQKKTNSFSIKKEILYHYFKTGDSSLQESKTNPSRQNAVTPSKTNVHINPEVIQKIESLINLPFALDAEDISNVCFANSPEVRDEFKSSFNTVDVLHYAYAVLHASESLEDSMNLKTDDTFKVMLPTNQDMFWQLADLGKRLRQETLSSLPSNKQHATALHNIIGEIRSIIR